MNFAFETTFDLTSVIVDEGWPDLTVGDNERSQIRE